jgi:hypothetical protein
VSVDKVSIFTPSLKTFLSTRIEICMDLPVMCSYMFQSLLWTFYCRQVQRREIWRSLLYMLLGPRRTEVHGSNIQMISVKSRKLNFFFIFSEIISGP